MARKRKSTRKRRRASKVLHFKSKKDYLNWLKALWANPRLRRKYAGKAPHAKIYIRGKLHKVKHTA